LLVDELALEAPAGAGAGGGDPLSARAGTVNTALAISKKNITAERTWFRRLLDIFALLYLLPIRSLHPFTSSLNRKRPAFDQTKGDEHKKWIFNFMTNFI
jgi:hypothetical protein